MSIRWHMAQLGFVQPRRRRQNLRVGRKLVAYHPIQSDPSSPCYNHAKEPLRSSRRFLHPSRSHTGFRRVAEKEAPIAQKIDTDPAVAGVSLSPMLLVLGYPS